MMGPSLEDFKKLWPETSEPSGGRGPVSSGIDFNAFWTLDNQEFYPVVSGAVRTKFRN